MKITKLLIFGILFALFLFIGAEDAFAANWYVSRNGSNADGRSWTTAWNEMDRINWSSIQPGDIIYLDGGTSSMTYRVPLTIEKAGSAGNPITIRPAAAMPNAGSLHSGLVIIDAGGSPNNGINLANYVTIDGNVNNQRKIRLQNGRFGVSGTGLTGVTVSFILFNGFDAAMSISNMPPTGTLLFEYNYAENIEGSSLAVGGVGAPLGSRIIRHNYLEARRYDGIAVDSGFDIYGNYLKKTFAETSTHPDGIVTQGGNNRIHHNFIQDFNQYIYLNAILEAGDNQEIWSNVIWQSPNYSMSYGPGINVHPEWKTISNVKIYNNVFRGHGIKFAGGNSISNITIRNNIAASITTESAQISGFNSDYNLFEPGAFFWWSGYTNSFATWKSQSGGDAHSIQVEPLYFDALSGKLWVTANSQAIDKGFTLGTAYQDALSPNTTWPDPGFAVRNGAWDIGAYEYSGSGGGTPTPTTGQCGTTLNACVVGALDDTADSATQYLWQCLGSNGGRDASCNLPRSTSGGGDIYYVATNGSDTNTGTLAMPFRTIRKGMSYLRSGDTLYIRGGEYDEKFENDLPFDNSGATSWSQAITIAAYNSEQVLLKPSSGYRVFTFESLRYAYLILDGLIIDAANISVDAVKISYGSDPLQSSHHIWFKNCVVKNSPGQGILTTGNADWNRFTNCEIYNNGTDDFDHGFYISTDNNIIEQSRIHDNTGWGVQVYDGAGTISNNIVRYSLVYDNTNSGRGAGIGLYSGPGHKAYGNIVWGNKYGISLNYGASGAEVSNNTLYLNGGNPLFDNGVNTTKYNNTLINQDVPNPIPPIPGGGGGGDTGGNQPPSVSITSLANNTTFSLGVPISLTATASDSADSISQIAFYRNGSLFAGGVDTTAPWNYQWSNASAGTYTIYAEATDSRGAVGRSPSITITVGSPSPTPSSCINPSNPPAGSAAPCPALSLSNSTPLSTDQLTITATPAGSYNYIYKTFYISEYLNGAWQWGSPKTFSCSQEVSVYCTTLASFTIPIANLQTASPGIHYIASWDWKWIDSCWKGPEGACGTGKWRVQKFEMK